jgi:hypothetical protein
MLMLTRGLQPNVVEKGDVSTLKLHGVLLAINLDREREKKLQPTVPDVVGAEQELLHCLHTRRADEDTVLPVEPAIPLIRERPALQALKSGMHCVSNLQSSVQAKVPFSKHGLAQLRTVLC